jgi:hypothetical protein
MGRAGKAGRPAWVQPSALKPAVAPGSTPVRWLGWFAALLLGLCLSLSAAVLLSATYADVQALAHITFHKGHYAWLPVRLGEVAFHRWQLVVAGTTGLWWLAVSAALWRRPSAQGELRQGLTDTWRTLTSTLRSLQELSPAQRWLAGSTLALLTASRVYALGIRPLHSDEVASYDFFVRRGLLAVVSFYPLPNNHVLANLLSWGFAQLRPGLGWAMQVPVLLTSLLGTLGLFAGLRRLSNFRVAYLTLFLFGWLHLSLYYAGAGRGYWLHVSLAGGQFLAVLALISPGLTINRERAAWTALLLCGVLGCFNIPAFAYVLVSAYACLGWHYLGWGLRRHPDWPRLRLAVGAGLLTLLGAALLYLPLLLISGPGRLLANEYVVAQRLPDFIDFFRPYVWRLEGTLLGYTPQGVLGLAAILLAWLILAGLSWHKLGSSAANLPLLRLGRPALAFVLLPYALLIAQRVYPPERVLFYKQLMVFLLLALVLDYWWQRSRWPQLARVGGLALPLLLFAGFQLDLQRREAQLNWPLVRGLQNSFHWLSRQPPGRVLVGPIFHQLYYLHYFHSQAPAPAWQLDSGPQPGVRYDYLVLPPGYHGPLPANLPAAAAYTDGFARIYQLPASKAIY